VLSVCSARHLVRSEPPFERTEMGSRLASHTLLPDDDDDYDGDPDDDFDEDEEDDEDDDEDDEAEGGYRLASRHRGVIATAV
jgi:hypothetical protein